MDATQHYAFTQYNYVNAVKNCRDNPDVMEEFRRNGIDVDLQEEDVLQSTEMCSRPRYVASVWAQPQVRTCAFCKTNGETRMFYTGHHLKDELGRVVCPVLSKYSCPFCGATGERAHTVKYCPLRPAQYKYNLNKTWERNAVGRVVPAKKFLPFY